MLRKLIFKQDEVKPILKSIIRHLGGTWVSYDLPNDYVQLVRVTMCKPYVPPRVPIPVASKGITNRPGLAGNEELFVRLIRDTPKSLVFLDVNGSLKYIYKTHLIRYDISENYVLMVLPAANLTKIFNHNVSSSYMGAAA